MEPDAVSKSESEIICKWKECEVLCASDEALFDHLMRIHGVRKEGSGSGATATRLHCKWRGCTVNPRFQKGTNSIIAEHLLTHTNYLPYSCSLCSRAFHRERDLSVHHKRSHSGKSRRAATSKDTPEASVDRDKALVLDRRSSPQPASQTSSVSGPGSTARAPSASEDRQIVSIDFSRKRTTRENQNEIRRALKKPRTDGTRASGSEVAVVSSPQAQALDMFLDDLPEHSNQIGSLLIVEAYKSATASLPPQTRELGARAIIEGYKTATASMLELEAGLLENE
ncbi:hypothetical protein EXIGLDRAFT_75564 [Exidia glandulosa HHB12029]|uniref:C2H2-type domain-containing protein n=1 Tax=Exidia glandulosa HHB12029 TaxID=1314781 RepID=A0A165HS74_EXIGL|nr:hypothetical protein EXIGLDRAFT_75564 [Exidia glandulosa HHB12029]